VSAPLPTVPLAAIAALPGIDLDALNAVAALQTRVDRKYIVPLRELPRLLADLPDGSEVLEIDGERTLRYSSQYFDTPALDSYFGAAHGRRRRFKVRTRTYVDSGGSFLEVKTRGARSATVKERVPVRDDELDDEAVAYATGLLADAAIPHADALAAALEPVLITRYRRATLLLPAAGTGDSSRATLDVDLAWMGRDGSALELPASVIVETKSGQRAGSLDRTLWRNGHRPAALSKYATGMAALHPWLPSHKWRRVLTRHFSDATPQSAAA